MNKRWTKQEEVFLHKNYIKLGNESCASKLDRSISSVKNKACELKCTKDKHSKYSQEEIIGKLKKLGLILLEKYYNTGKKYKIKCYCGKIFYTKMSNILNNGTKSCGCLLTETLKKRTLSEDKVKVRLKNTNIKLLEKYKGADINHKFLCYCGNTFLARPCAVFNKNTNSCGCYHKKITSERNRKDITGFLQKNGKLKVVGLDRYENGVSYWKCLCRCGLETITRGSDILLEKAKTCGNCSYFRNGIKTSWVALNLHKQLIDFGYHTSEKDHNYKVEQTSKGRYIDIAIPKLKIAIEYDSQRYHKNNLSRDLKKTKELQKAGWKVLRIRAYNSLPRISTIIKRIEKLKNNKSTYEVITMKDWYK
jgi:hypothetical protein